MGSTPLSLPVLNGDRSRSFEEVGRLCRNSSINVIASADTAPFDSVMEAFPVADKETNATSFETSTSPQ